MNKNYEESKTLDDLNNINHYKLNRLSHNSQYKIIIIMLIFFIIQTIIFTMSLKIHCSKNDFKQGEKKYILNKVYQVNINRTYSNKLQKELLREKNRPCLKEINKKRNFEVVFPLPKEINCRPHLYGTELIAFLSFLTKDTIYFETGSGCSSLIAKHYAKKSYAVEGCKDFYELGIKNGLKDNIIFHDLKPDIFNYIRLI